MATLLPPSTAVPPAPTGAALVRHEPALRRYLHALGARRDEVDELVQEVLLVACRAALPADEAAARAFLRGVARNHWLRTRRWWRRRREREVAAAVEQLWCETADADAGEALVAALRACLDTLGGRARQALDLHYGDGLAWHEVAARVGLRPNGVKTLVQRARQALRTCIERRTA